MCIYIYTHYTGLTIPSLSFCLGFKKISEPPGPKEKVTIQSLGFLYRFQEDIKIIFIVVIIITIILLLLIIIIVIMMLSSSFACMLVAKPGIPQGLAVSLW